MDLTLAIESAIAGGSLSLLDGSGREIANWIGGDADVARAEDLLVNIDSMLSSAGVAKQDLALVAVSAGPGSFTGIRIGIATALGLKTGLSIEMSSVSALDPICRNAGTLPARVDDKYERAGSPRSGVTVALPVGRNSICIQRCSVGSPVEDPRTVPERDFGELIGTGSQFILHRLLFEKYGTLPNTIDFGANIAYAIGRTATPGVVTEPLFISKSF